MLSYLQICLTLLALSTILAVFGGKTWTEERPFSLRKVTLRGWIFLGLSLLTCICNIVKDQTIARDNATQHILLSNQNIALHEDNTKLQASVEAQKTNISTLDSTLAKASQRLESQNQLLLLTQLSGRKLSRAAFQIEMPEGSNLAQDPIEFLASRIPTEFREYVEVSITFSAISGFTARKTYYYKDGLVMCDDFSVVV